MSKWKTVLLSLVVTIVLVAGGVAIFVSKNVSPEKIKHMAEKTLMETFPNANVVVGAIDYSLGLSVKVNVEKVTIDLKDGKGGLFSVKNLLVKIPLWAIITSGGTIDVRLDSPKISYIEFAKGNNWNLAMGEGKEKPAPVVEDKKENLPSKKIDKVSGDKEIVLPLFVTRSRLNLKLTDLVLNYKLKDNSAGEVVLSRFLVKNLNLSGTTAFELASEINLELSKTRKASLETLVIGQFNLSDYISEKKLPLDVVLELKKISISDLPYQIPDVKTEIKTTILKDGTITGSLLTTFLSSRVGLSFSLLRDQTKISDINSDIALSDIFDTLALKIAGLDHNKSKLNLSGTLSIKNMEKSSALIPDLAINLNPGVAFSVEGEKTTTTVKATFKRDQLNALISTSLLGGHVDSEISQALDLSKPAIDITKLPPFMLKIKAAALALPKDKIQKIIYADSGKKTETKTPAPQTSTTQNNKKLPPPAPVVLPNGKIEISFDNIKIDNERLDVNGDMSVGGNRIDIKKLNFKFADGTGELKQTVVLDTKSTNVALDFKLSSLNLRGISPFLPPMVDGVSGIFSGTVKGSVVSAPNNLKHDIAVDVSAKNGEIKGVDISGYINSVLEKVPMLKEKLGGQTTKIPSNFDSFVFQGKLTETHYTLSKIFFLGVGKSVEISGKGDLYPISTKDEGVIDLDYIDQSGKIGPLLEKNVGTKVLPVRLKGIGFALMPDYAYTAGKLAKGAIATKGKEKLQDLAGKLLKKNQGDNSKSSPVDDVLKNKKVDSLIKGFFK